MKLVHALHIAMVYTCIRPSWQQQKDFLLVAFEKTIERIDPVTGHSELVPISNKAGGQIINIDFDVKHNCLFYSTCCPGEIIQKCLDNRAEEMVIVENAEISTGLSYDWVSELLYFTTAEAQHKIEIVKIVHADGNGNRTQMKNYMRRTIVGNLNSRILVRDILVDPVNRYLFWVDISPEQSPHIVQYTAESPTIWRAYLDGSHAQKIHTCTFEMNPIRLSLRYDMNQIYWTGQEWYASSDLNGDIIIKIYLRPDPDHIAVTKDHLYWSNSKTQSVYVRNRGDFYKRF